ncbi:MAG: hypothetical protein CMM95_02290 [Rickettsiales bacterium]|nr:hypothetical protein [Rickettsiales bacterium]
MGILIENYSGKFPNWLSPIQVAIASINEKCKSYVIELEKKLHNENIRCKVDLRNEKLNYKIRELSLEKIPFVAVVGDKEVEQKTVMLRELGNKAQTSLKIDEFVKKIKNSCRI